MSHTSDSSSVEDRVYYASRKIEPLTQIAGIHRMVIPLYLTRAVDGHLESSKPDEGTEFLR
jgi:hypothetical protein